MESSTSGSALPLQSDIERTEPTSNTLLPPFAARQYSHLPTPQSPLTVGRYGHEPQSPESPVRHVSSSGGSSAFTHRAVTPRLLERGPSGHRQCITPEASPYHSSPFPSSATPRFLHTPTNSRDFATPRGDPFPKLESPIPLTPTNAALRISSPSPPPNEQPPPMALSSPFMANASVARKQAPSPSRRPVILNDIFSSSSARETASTASPPLSPRLSSDHSFLGSGREMERVRQAMEEGRLMQARETEKRRPEYLVRSKRALDGTHSPDIVDPPAPTVHGVPVGIMESPVKGRRLKLFQETSEESFEESLMAGGYGRYRTSDWVRQPQPLPLAPPATPGASTAAKILEETQDQPPSEKEVKKRRRLEAFQSEPAHLSSKLCAVELEGKGRVLVDLPVEETAGAVNPDVVPTKKKGGSRRKRKIVDISNHDKKSTKPNPNVVTEKPNWPDAEFPWRLRSEERAELVKEQESERLKWIERFLDRDSDSDTEDEDSIARSHDGRATSPPHHGGAKTVPLNTYTIPEAEALGVPQHTFPTDPADALAALMAKRSVRTLSYRQQVRRRQGEYGEDQDGEVVCICRGKDDGRELVQCDACQTWYHLGCIGIKDVSELGREEDPWFCRRCVVRSPSPSGVPSEILSSEPTFVPTDEGSFGHRSSDATLFQPSVHESPNWQSARAPRTPTRTSFGQPQPWFDSAKYNPTTPQRYTGGKSQGYLTLRSMDGQLTQVDDLPLDLTSTPSRGIKFNAPFATPKSNLWHGRPLFQTPKGNTTRGPTRSLGGLGSLAAALEEPVHPVFGHPGRALYEESPVRRNKSLDGTPRRKTVRSPRYPTSSVLDESPIMRSSEAAHH